MGREGQNRPLAARANGAESKTTDITDVTDGGVPSHDENAGLWALAWLAAFVARFPALSNKRHH